MPMKTVELAAKLHPATWWMLGLIFVGTSVVAKNAEVLIAALVSSVLLMILFANDSASALKVYGALATLVFTTRVAFRIIFNFATDSDEILFSLPKVEVDFGFGEQVNLFGEVSRQAIEYASVDGLRLATIVLSIGMANSICNPRKLLKSTPSALYEIAAAVSMAINLVPQLIQSYRRVNSAMSLRGRSSQIGSMAGLIVPVLEDTIESSMNLAASMSTRGFGRTGPITQFARITIRASSLTAVALILVGSYFALTIGALELPTLALISAGLLLTFISLKRSSVNRIRTALNQQKFQLIDYVVLIISISVPLWVMSGW